MRHIEHEAVAHVVAGEPVQRGLCRVCRKQLIDAGSTYLVSEAEWQDRRTAPGVRCLALPGHTAGQIGFSIESRGQRLLAFADAFHSPVQITNPEWPLMGDPFPAASGGA